MRVISLSRSGSLRGFSGSEQWIAWLCPNGFGGSIFMDWVAPPPWNTHREKLMESADEKPWQMTICRL